MSTIAERVAAGAAFLDEHDPGWWKPDVERSIDLGTLALSEPADCILGQRCPVGVLAEFCHLDPGDEDGLSHEWWRAYTAYASVLSGIAIGDDHFALIRWGDAHGFSNSVSAASYPNLTAEWLRVIEQRRAQVTPMTTTPAQAADQTAARGAQGTGN